MSEDRPPIAETAPDENKADERVMGQHVPTAEERLYGAHRRLAEAESQLGQAASFFEEWPAEDEEGARYADHMRMVIDGLFMTVEGVGELLWLRYGRKTR